MNLEILERDSLTLFKEPNTELDWYGKDKPGLYKLGGHGTDVYTKDIVQNDVWDHVTYKFNSLGLRGPEPDYNAKQRVLGAGGSFLLGTGVNVEDSFIYKVADTLNGSFINLSDADSLTDLFEHLDEWVEKFKPTVIILSDTRFFDEYGWTWRFLYANFRKVFGKEKVTTFSEVLRDRLANRNRKILELYLFYIQTKYNVPTFFVTTDRKDFRFGPNLKSHGVHVYNNNPVDLGRDNRHPGRASHTMVSDWICNILKE